MIFFHQKIDNNFRFKIAYLTSYELFGLMKEILNFEEWENLIMAQNPHTYTHAHTTGHKRLHF